MGEEARILTAIMGAGEERKRRTGGGGMVLEGCGLLASTKWCYGTVASLGGASIYQKKIDTQEVCPLQACAWHSAPSGPFYTPACWHTHCASRGVFRTPP